MKIFILISRLITGIVFTFSGFVKAVDPVGTQIKFGDYFSAMGLEWLMPASLVFSFLMNAAEFGIGLMLIFNVFPKFTAWTALLFLTIFTPLTLWLAVANPVTDCGCFGDAITLTNWETFWKNIILLVFVLSLFFMRNKINTNFQIKKSVLITGIIVAGVFLFQFHNFYNLPVIDFRPFKEGANISEKIIIPKDAPKDEYETVLVYKNTKTGKPKEFTIKNCPYDDTENWTYDTTFNTLIKKGYEPPIHDFVISNLRGKNITEKILKNPKNSLILISPDLEKANLNDIKNIEKLADYCSFYHLKFYYFTASGQNVIKKFRSKFPKNLKFCTADKKMLKTFIRSNPGLVILKSGIIKKKYHYRNIPKVEELKLEN